MRHRLQTKYRDLTIIAFLFCSSFLVCSMLIILIVKIYIPNHHKWLILSGPYQKKDVDVNAIFSSSVQLSDGIIVKVNDLFYRVNLSPDQKTYNLVEVSLVNPEIEIIKN
jgi:hypothetical protein